MKSYIILCLISISALFYSCGGYSLLLNEQKKYVLTCNENRVEFRATTIRTSIYYIYIKSLKGEFYVNMKDSLFLSKYNNINPRFIHFEYDKKEVPNIPVIKEGKTLICFFMYYPEKWGKGETIIIPPSNFIMCEDKPLVTDTIRISLK